MNKIKLMYPGEIRTYDGRKFIAVKVDENNQCQRCYFENFKSCINVIRCLGACSIYIREDNEIIFQEVKEENK